MKIVSTNFEGSADCAIIIINISKNLISFYLKTSTVAIRYPVSYIIDNRFIYLSSRWIIIVAGHPLMIGDYDIQDLTHKMSSHYKWNVKKNICGFKSGPGRGQVIYRYIMHVRYGRI